MAVVQAISIENKGVRLFKEGLTVILGSVLLALCSKISIPLFFTPVPITIQNTLILFLAALLGPRKGGAIALGLLAQTAMGFSVLSSGAAGLASFVGPTGGYLVGYLVSALLTGWLRDRLPKSPMAAFWAMAAGNLAVYVLGAGFLSTIVGLRQAFWLGVAPFMIGDLFKLLAATKILQQLEQKKGN